MASLPEQQLKEALVRHQAGDVDGAVALYRAILAQEPAQADALHMLGVAAKQKGNPELALKLIEAALATRPDTPFGWHNRSLILRMLGRKQDALESSKQAVALDPLHAEAWNAMAVLARETGNLRTAFACHDCAMRLRPQDMQFRSDYALALYASGDLAGAFKAMQKVVRDENVSPLTLANVLKSAGYPERALPYFRRASELMPEVPEVKATEAMALLQIGAYAKAWPVWEARPESDTRYNYIPLWHGNPVERLLLYEDQGAGDAMQHARFIPLLYGRGKKVTLHVAPALVDLFTENFPDICVVGNDKPVPEADARIRVASLPAWHCATLETVPGASYLHAREEWRVPWRERLKAVGKPRVGLVWGGNPDNPHDRNRSVPFAQLAPLIEAGSGHLICLQKGASKMQADLAAARIFDAEPWLDSFAATAGLLDELDLVITVCTSPAHLAGAMGRPGWVMLCFDPHWVWMLEREDSPWYPSLRLFRQTEAGNWTPVVAQVADELRKFLAGDASVLKPKAWQRPPAKKNAHAIELGVGDQELRIGNSA